MSNPQDLRQGAISMQNNPQQGRYENVDSGYSIAIPESSNSFAPQQNGNPPLTREGYGNIEQQMTTGYSYHPGNLEQTNFGNRSNSIDAARMENTEFVPANEQSFAPPEDLNELPRVSETSEPFNWHASHLRQDNSLNEIVLEDVQPTESIAAAPEVAAAPSIQVRPSLEMAPPALPAVAMQQSAPTLKVESAFEDSVDTAQTLKQQPSVVQPPRDSLTSREAFKFVARDIPSDRIGPDPNEVMLSGSGYPIIYLKSQSDSALRAVQNRIESAEARHDSTEINESEIELHEQEYSKADDQLATSAAPKAELMVPNFEERTPVIAEGGEHAETAVRTDFVVDVAESANETISKPPSVFDVVDDRDSDLDGFDFEPIARENTLRTEEQPSAEIASVTPTVDDAESLLFQESSDVTAAPSQMAASPETSFTKVTTSQVQSNHYRPTQTSAPTGFAKYNMHSRMDDVRLVNPIANQQQTAHASPPLPSQVIQPNFNFASSSHQLNATTSVAPDSYSAKNDIDEGLTWLNPWWMLVMLLPLGIYLGSRRSAAIRRAAMIDAAGSRSQLPPMLFAEPGFSKSDRYSDEQFDRELSRSVAEATSRSHDATNVSGKATADRESSILTFTDSFDQDDLNRSDKPESPNFREF